MECPGGAVERARTTQDSQMPVRFTSREISDKYNQFARWYDWVESIPDILGVRTLRRQLLQAASGRVLEVAVGTGKNLRFYRRGCRMITMDVSRGMLIVAQRRARRLSMDVSFSLADAEAMPFSDKSFDTVVSSLSTCTFPNPIGALREMARVCKPAGRILLLEHGRSDREWLAGWQDRRADSFAKRLGCHWNREPLELAREAGLKIVDARRVFLGILQPIEATPSGL